MDDDSGMTMSKVPHTIRIDPAAGRQVLSLNGTWSIAPTRDTAPPSEYPHTIPVPSVVDCAEPSYDWQSAFLHWYRTSFRLDNSVDRLVFLKIGQSQFGTDVWVNDVHVGGSISCYTSQEYEISRFLRTEGEDNNVVVRVGRKENLPTESAVGKDQEKTIYTPGIWGDVAIIVCGNPRVRIVQIIPDVRAKSAEARVTVENRHDRPHTVSVAAQAWERKNGKEASRIVWNNCTVPASASIQVALTVPIEDPHLWSPESPFLYEMHTTVRGESGVFDEVKTTFGMREFRIEGNSFLLNGEKILLKGGNIAFHRFLADKERALLPWDRSWIRKVLVDIPKEHHFNFFRNHLGQMYPPWYEIADEEGMLIQNEWHFWGTTGTKEQIRREFSDWIRDNGNHPSIVIWDPLNESTDEFVQKELVPELRDLDPTRPWESVDFVEEHPYIYSLGPVINESPFGFTRPVLDSARSSQPVVFNEFLWWWLNNEGRPTALMEGVVERWLGRTWTIRQLMDHQSFLAQELIELFRRLGVSAIQPFVYLSNNDGPTGHWFQGPIAQLQPKPVLAAIKNAYAPVGVSIELWDRHFAAGEQREIRVFLFNDTSRKADGRLQWWFRNEREERMSEQSQMVNLEGYERRIVEIHPVFPGEPGRYALEAELRSESGSPLSSKKVHVFHPVKKTSGFSVATIGVSEETSGFLESYGFEHRPFSDHRTEGYRVLIAGEGSLSESFISAHEKIGRFVRNGGSLILLEPEFGVHDTAVLKIDDVRIEMRWRENRDKGGYDSYVFMDDPSHVMWNGIAQEHLCLFNGGLGGEIVSQHDLAIGAPHVVLARCGLKLGVIALAEIPLGKGKVLLSRLQTRGRLSGRGNSGLYDRRPDPVAQKYFLNLLLYAAKGTDY